MKKKIHAGMREVVYHGEGSLFVPVTVKEERLEAGKRN